MDPNYDPTGGAAVAAAVAVFGIIFFLIAIAAYVISSFFYMKLFEKAGVEGKWRAWVPVYREMIFAKLGDLSPWWVLVLLGAALVINMIPYLGLAIGWIVSIASVVYLALAAYRVQTKLGKEPAWVILYVFLSIVWLGIMALDRSRWNTAIAPAPWASTFLADKTVWNGIPVQTPAAGYQAPPVGYQPPAPGYAAPPAPPAAPASPPAAQQTPEAPPAPPAAPEPPRP